MRRGIIETLKLLGYIVFGALFIIVGCIYKPLSWITHKCADFDQDCYEETP